METYLNFNPDTEPIDADLQKKVIIVTRVSHQWYEWYNETHGKYFNDIVKYVNDGGYVVWNLSDVYPYNLISQFWFI